MNHNTRNNAGIFVKIHDNVLESLQHAKKSILGKDIEGQYTHTKHAADFILRMQEAIANSGAEGIDELVNIYGQIYRNLHSAVGKPDANSDIDASMEAINKLSKMWITSGSD